MARFVPELNDIQKMTIVLATALSLIIPILSAEVSIETYPENTTAESTAIIENLISGILDEVRNG